VHEQPFRTDVEYYEGRADGIATTSGVGVDEARHEFARRHGFDSWTQLLAQVENLPETPFVLAYRAVEAGDRARLEELLDEHPELVRVRGTNGNDLLGMAGGTELVRLLLERGADPNRGNDYGWTKLHQAGYGNRRGLAELLLAHGARTDLSARGDGGTPLVQALFWGHREVVDLLGREPGNLRVAAGLGDVAMIRELARTPAAGAHRAFYRPHGGFTAWQPSDDPQEVSTRRSSGPRSPAAPRRSSCSSSWAPTSPPTRIAARRSRGPRATGARPQSAGSSSSGPTRTSAGASAAPLTARASRPCTSPRSPVNGRPSRSWSSSAPIRDCAMRCTTAPRPAGPSSAATPSLLRT
jgi:hypothetical protein